MRMLRIAMLATVALAIPVSTASAETAKPATSKSSAAMEYVLNDLDSRNGTFLNGRRVRRDPMRRA